MELKEKDLRKSFRIESNGKERILGKKCVKGRLKKTISNALKSGTKYRAIL